VKIKLLFLMIVMSSVCSAQEQPAQGQSGPSPVNGEAVFQIVPRIPELTYHPCTQCHQFLIPNTEIRELQSPHPSELDHGDGRMWCLTCHKVDDRDYLTTLLGEAVSFDDAPTVCGSCHMQRHNDWTFGGHGKRVSNWQGERVIYSCPQCHDPHNPQIKPRAPKPAPPLRKGLEPHEGMAEANEPVRERLEKELDQE